MDSPPYVQEMADWDSRKCQAENAECELICQQMVTGEPHFFAYLNDCLGGLTQ